MDSKIKKILKETKKKTMKIGGLIKPLAGPILLPPKIGWKMAKFGIKVAKKPIEKLVPRAAERVVIEINPEAFKKMMIASAKKIVLHQEEINKINVWPVADKDTGYNLAATLLGIEGTIAQKDYPNFRELTKDIKESAMVNARGNAGMIYTGYLIEILDRIKHLELLDAFHLALAMRSGINSARHSIINPTEGTILDVIRAVGEKTYGVVRTRKEKNIIKILEEGYAVGQLALEETKEKLEVLKQNDVVDAGALGFIKILEAWIENLKGLTISPELDFAFSAPSNSQVEELKYRYEVILSFKETEDIDLEKVKKEISPLGNSIEVLGVENKIKFHIHTDQPNAVTGKFKNFPEFEFKVEDMEEQRKKIQKKNLGLVVDEIADLPKEFLENYDIEEVHFTTRFPDGEIITSKEEIYPKMREALKNNKPLPTTSAPSFKEFQEAYNRALKKFEKILVITTSSKLSGAYSSARIARSTFKKPEKLNIFVFDCSSGEVSEGLIDIKAQELISEGKKREEIIEELKDFCPEVELLGWVDDFRYVAHGGRIKIPKIFVSLLSLIQKTGIRFLVMLKNGKVKFFGIRFGKNIAKILAEEVDKERKGKGIRAAIGHADNLKLARDLKKELEKKPKIKVLFISLVSPVVGTHAGPGTLTVAFHPVDDVLDTKIKD